MSDIQQKKILLVEDEAIIAEMEKRQLEREGYSVIIALSGEEAIETVTSGGETIDLILMDVDLGRGMDGTEAATEILKDYEIPVVFLSSHTEKEVVQKTEKITSYGYVVKNSGIIVLDASIKMAFRLFQSKFKEREKNEALRESREIFRDLSDKAIVGIYFIQDDRFLYANAMLAEILGYRIDELVYVMGPGDVIFHEDWPFVERNMAKIISGEQQSSRYEFRIRTCGGDIKDVEVYSSRTVFKGKPGIIGTLVDITERKNYEKELKKINERLQLITENMSEGVVLTDMNMHVKYITPSVTKRHGYTLEELNSIPVEKRMSKESCERFMKMASEELTPEKLADPDADIFRVIELEFYRKDGSSCWSESSFRLVRDSSGAPAGILGVGRDITERKHVEHALLESEERFSKLSEDIPVYICTFLPDSSMTYVNPSLAAMFGTDVKELTGRKFFEFLAPSELEFVKRSIRELNPGHPAESHQQTHHCSDGSVRYHEWINRAFFDESGKAFRYLAVGIDITERRVAEEKLKQQNLAMDAAIDGIAILDAEQNYIYLNRAHAEIYGYNSADELVGRSWRTLYDGEELQRFEMEIMPRFMKNGYYRGVALGRKKDGSMFDQELSLTALDNGGFVCIVRDISERKKVDVSLRESEEKYRLLVDHTSDLIWNLTAEGIFTYVSPSWKRVTGYDPELLTGKSFQPLVHPEDLDLCLRYLDDMTRSGEVLSSPEYRVRHADGTWHWHSATGTPVIGSDGHFVSMVGVSRDVTERKLAGDQIRELLKEKELILKEVHHRVKNNMNTIFGLLALQADAHDDSEAKSILLDSAGRVQSMMVLYDKLYRSEINRTVPVQEYFPALIREIAAIFPHKADVEITTNIDDIELNADMLSPLSIIINELVTNAMKYAFSGRTDGNIHMKASKRGGRVIIVFEDNGEGIPETVTFETSSGFGLQLVSMLVRQLKGSVKIERDGGTRFIIEFKG